ncbi:hypothetical protein ACFXJ6_19325 [Streptomyces sp. NPDC059218]|uniref:hypothetical protein n=1 Tax=unclassified Streptomyces TaxID=2593676 RepID=UPI0036A070E4
MPSMTVAAVTLLFMVFSPSLTGFVVFGGQVAGMVAPPVIGALADAFSFRVAFASLVLGAAIAAVMALLTPQDTASFRTATGLPDLPAPAKELS